VSVGEVKGSGTRDGGKRNRNQEPWKALERRKRIR